MISRRSLLRGTAALALASVLPTAAGNDCAWMAEIRDRLLAGIEADRAGRAAWIATLAGANRIEYRKVLVTEALFKGDPLTNAGSNWFVRPVSTAQRFDAVFIGYEGDGPGEFAVRALPWPA